MKIVCRDSIPRIKIANIENNLLYDNSIIETVLLPMCVPQCLPQISSQNKAVLEPRVSPAFANTYFCNHCNIRFENTSKYVDTLILFSKNLNQRSLTPT